MESTNDDLRPDELEELLSDDESDVDDDTRLKRKLAEYEGAPKRDPVLDKFKGELIWGKSGPRLRSRASKRRSQIVKIVQADVHALIITARFAIPLATLAFFPYIIRFVFNFKLSSLLSLIGALIVSCVIVTYTEAFFFRSSKRRMRDVVNGMKAEQMLKTKQKNAKRDELRAKTQHIEEKITISPFL